MSLIDNAKAEGTKIAQSFKAEITSHLDRNPDYDFDEALDDFLNDAFYNNDLTTKNVEESLEVIKECLVDRKAREPDEFPFLPDVPLSYDLHTKATRILEDAALDQMEIEFNNIVGEYENERKVSTPEM